MTGRQTDHAPRSLTIGGIYLRIKGKKENKKVTVYIAPFVYYVYQRAQAWITQVVS